MEQYCIHAVPDAPEVRLIYIKGMHSVNSWRSEVNLSQCKINLFVEGHSYIIINGKSHVANAGDILLYRPHDIHYGDIPYEQMIEYFELLFEPAALTSSDGRRCVGSPVCRTCPGAAAHRASSAGCGTVEIAERKLLSSAELSAGKSCPWQFDGAIHAAGNPVCHPCLS
ncbi:MAG: AraC family ligand binding domain-containing protein [Gallintestinimicrobium sp.]